MPKLYKTACITDWKGRPTHILEPLGEGTREELVALMDRDVLAWQARDLQDDQELEDEEAEAEGREPKQCTTWEQPDTRWEMRVRGTPDAEHKPRQFAEAYDDGGFWSLVYHLVD